MIDLDQFSTPERYIRTTLSVNYVILCFACEISYLFTQKFRISADSQKHPHFLPKIINDLAKVKLSLIQCTPQNSFSCLHTNLLNH